MADFRPFSPCWGDISFTEAPRTTARRYAGAIFLSCSPFGATARARGVAWPRCPWAVAGPGRAKHSDKPRRRGGRRRDLPRCRWAAAGPGRASRRRAERSSQRGRLAGGPPPTGTHSGRTQRRPAARGHTKPPDPTGAGRFRQSVRGTQRRITTMSGSPRPLS